MGRPLLTFAGALVTVGLSLVAHAADPATIARSGVGAATACASCHGARGEGQSAFPRLAGQNAGYLARQLDDFAAGRRANPVMGPIAKALSADDRRAMATYYSGMATPTSAQPTLPASAPGGWLASLRTRRITSSSASSSG